MNSRYGCGRGMRRRGAVMVQTVLFGGIVGLGVAALAIDTGLMYSAKQELQSAADSAALAAASQLGKAGDASNLAIEEAKKFAKFNEVMGEDADLVDADVTFGHADLVGNKYEFQPGAEPMDAVRVTLKRDPTVNDGPVSLLFAKTFGMTGARLQASAVAMLVRCRCPAGCHWRPARRERSDSGRSSRPPCPWKPGARPRCHED